METKIDTVEAVKICKSLSEKNKVLVKVLKCEQNDQGLVFFYLAPERTDLRPIARDLNRHFKIKIGFKELDAQEAAALIPGYGPCGTRISWLTDACGNLWDCTCDPTANKNGEPIETMQISVQTDSSVKETQQSAGLELKVGEAEEGREGEKEGTRPVEARKKEPVKEDKKKKGKFVRRLVLK